MTHDERAHARGDPREPRPVAALLGRDPRHGPAFCPSLEDKVVKFPERISHHLFLEPEGRDVPEIYVNGVS